MWSVITAALLSPVSVQPVEELSDLGPLVVVAPTTHDGIDLLLAFLTAIAVEIFIGVLKDAGILEFLAVGAMGAIYWLLLRKLRVRPSGSASVET
jgi:hypothetical protein